MMKSLRLWLPLCAVALLLRAGETLPARAPAEFVADPAQSTVEFTLADVLHTVHGTFQLTSASLHFDDNGKASGEIVVDARSGDSGSKARDKRMHANILESEKYPRITFRPDRVDGKPAAEGKSQVQVHGMFGIHGAEHEITVPVTVDAAGGRYTATAAFIVPYVKWGMKNPSNLILRVNDKVEITVRLAPAVRAGSN